MAPTRAGGVVWGSRWAPAACPYLCWVFEYWGCARPSGLYCLWVGWGPNACSRLLAQAAELCFCALTGPSLSCRWRRLIAEDQPAVWAPQFWHPFLVPSDPAPPLLLSCLIHRPPLPRPSLPAASPSSHRCHRALGLAPSLCPVLAPRNLTEGAGRRRTRIPKNTLAPAQRSLHISPLQDPSLPG